MGETLFLKGSPAIIDRFGRMIKPAEPDATIHFADSAHGKPNEMAQCQGCKHYESVWNLCRKRWKREGARKLLYKCKEVAKNCKLADMTTT